jgi:RNA polymerase sigma factor (sigma-70 family)
MQDNDSIPTRQSLLGRLRDWGDQESWRQFFDTYWRLIHGTALKAGLTEAEAQEVVQEVMLAAAKKMPGFTYDPAKDSLKGWLLAVTRWKVGDQFRKREKAAFPQPASTLSQLPAPGRSAGRHTSDDSPRTATIDRVPDPHHVDALWDAEWRENLLRAALSRVKARVNPAHYERYHLHVVQGLSVRETARALDTNTAAVHLATHRVGKLVKAELKRLQAQEKPPFGGESSR